jgi:hypothetical protein
MRLGRRHAGSSTVCDWGCPVPPERGEAMTRKWTHRTVAWGGGTGHGYSRSR